MNDFISLPVPVSKIRRVPSKPPVATNSTLGWFDAASSVMPQRFYRAIKLNDPAPQAVAAE